MLICSTDIDELASLCDRVVVLHQGRVSAKLAGDALSTHAVLEAMNTDARRPDHGSNVASCATTTSSSSGVGAVGERRQQRVEALEQLVVGGDALARAALRARQRADVDRVDRAATGRVRRCAPRAGP